MQLPYHLCRNPGSWWERRQIGLTMSTSAWMQLMKLQLQGSNIQYKAFICRSFPSDLRPESQTLQMTTAARPELIRLTFPEQLSGRLGIPEPAFRGTGRAGPPGLPRGRPPPPLLTHSSTFTVTNPPPPCLCLQNPSQTS